MSDTTIERLLESKGRDVYTIGTTATVFETMQMMTERRAGCLIVCFRDGRIAGIVSERDCLRRVVLRNLSPRKVAVRAIMTPAKALVTATPDETLDRCMQVMTEHRIRHLPVLGAGGKLAGLVSIGDVVKHLCSEQGLLIQNLEQYITGSN